MKHIIAIFTIMAASIVCHADGFYVEVGAYVGSTDYKIITDEFTCVSQTKYGCTAYAPKYEDINGPFSKLEFGYEYGNLSGNCFHLSSMSTSKDVGMKLLCGGSYRFK